MKGTVQVCRKEWVTQHNAYLQLIMCYFYFCFGPDRLFLSCLIHKLVISWCRLVLVR